MNDVSTAWVKALHETLEYGIIVSPRGRVTKEVPHRTLTIDMRRPVLTIKERNLSYQFMAAEAYWILTGDDKVAGIAPYNKRIAEFSDDGTSFFGAYGPKILGQLNYVVSKLVEDPMSRQAGLTIWRENPPPTKDVPCTVAIFFSIRNKKLNCHTFMRSSDLWLGIPYDVFNFSMLGHLVCALVNYRSSLKIEPGLLHITAASSHLYQENWKAASEIFQSGLPQPATPKFLYDGSGSVVEYLDELRRSKPGSSLRWWEYR